MSKEPPISVAEASRLLRRQKGEAHLPTALEAHVDPPELSEELALVRALIRKHGQTATPVKLEVTPGLAKAFLHLMGVNRKLQGAWVTRWMRALERGGWKDIPNQGMAFDWHGVFRDGQHRCQAIINSGIAADVWVAFGVDPDAFPVMDTGVRRNAALNLKMLGLKQADQVSYVVRLKYRTEHEGEMPDDGFVFENAMDMTTADDDLHHGIAIGLAMRREHKGVTVSSTALAYWLIAKRNPRSRRLATFFEGLTGDGAGFDADHPIHKLRRRFRPLASAGRKAGQYLNQTQQAAWIIQGWNAWLAGKSIPAKGDGSKWPTWSHAHRLPGIDKG